MTWAEFSGAYCERQESTPTDLAKILRGQVERFNPVGFMLLECMVFDSSYFGSYTILPFGPNNTYKDVPDHPISPRGLASDQSIVAGLLRAEDVP